MSEPIDAIFDHGVFRPLEPLTFPDQARVRLTVEPKSAEDNSARENADFEAELDPLLFDGPNLPADFSRADIYQNHD